MCLPAFFYCVAAKLRGSSMKNKLAWDNRYYNIFEKDGYYMARIVETEKEGLDVIRISKPKRDVLLCPRCTEGKKCFRNSRFLTLLHD